MGARFAFFSLFPIALAARLFRRRTSRYHKLVDAVVRVAVVVRIAAVVARFVSLRGSFSLVRLAAFCSPLYLRLGVSNVLCPWRFASHCR